MPMYSRFTPGPDGSYQRKQVGSAKAPPKPSTKSKEPSPAPPPPSPPVKVTNPPASLRSRLTQLLPQEMELGDVLVLLISLLLLVDAEEDFQTILITAAAFFLL